MALIEMRLKTPVLKRIGTRRLKIRLSACFFMTLSVEIGNHLLSETIPVVLATLRAETEDCHARLAVDEVVRFHAYVSQERFSDSECRRSNRSRL